jgi:hypothetical protein
MSDLRKDPIVGRWVIIATDRAKRPQDFARLEPVKAGGFCPFCKGNEANTPPEILAYREPHTAANNPGWRVRVVPNKFPALQVEGALNKRGDGIYDLMNGVGAHEVIIECPHHETSMSRLSVDNSREILWVYRDRLVDLKRDPRLVHGLIFKNVGALAGASLELAYVLENKGERELPFVWCLHALLAIEPGMRLELPGGEEIVPGPERRFAEKRFVGSGRGGVGLRTADGREALRFRFDPREIPFVGLWQNYGRWSGAGTEPYFNLGIEPSIGDADSLDEARTRGTAGVLAPGARRTWRVTLALVSL